MPSNATRLLRVNFRCSRMSTRESELRSKLLHGISAPLLKHCDVAGRTRLVGPVVAPVANTSCPVTGVVQPLSPKMYSPLSCNAYGSSQMPLNVKRFCCTPASYHCAASAGWSVIGTSHTNWPDALIVNTCEQPGAIGSR